MIAPDVSSDLKITALSPMGYPPQVTRKTAAPRLESLDGRTIYLVDADLGVIQSANAKPGRILAVDRGRNFRLGRQRWQP